MAKAVMGIDFLGLEDGNAAAAAAAAAAATSQPGVPMDTKRAAAAAPPAAAGARRRGDDLLFLSPLPSAPQLRLIPRFLAQMPVRNPAAPSGSAAQTSPASAGGGGAAAPLTIFYNGTVATFHLPPDKAEAIINWADRTTQPRARRMERPAVAVVDNTGRRPPPQHFSLDKLGSTDLPLARKRSLQRFLEKRKER